jgi:hypothetical protein
MNFEIGDSLPAFNLYDMYGIDWYSHARIRDYIIVTTKYGVHVWRGYLKGPFVLVNIFGTLEEFCERAKENV